MAGTSSAPLGAPMQLDGGSRRYLAVLAGVIVAIAVLAGLLGRAYFDQQRALIQKQEHEELAAIARLKVDEIARWRQAALNQAQFMNVRSPNKADFTAWATAPDPAITGRVIQWLEDNSKYRGFNRLLIYEDRGGKSLTNDGTSASAHDLELVRTTLKATGVAMTEPYRDGENVYVDVTAPMVANDGIRLALLMRIDMKSFLYPLIQTWPIPTASSETLLLKRDGDAIVYLNDLRFRDDAALKLRVPLTSKEVLGVQAATGASGVRTGKDYRGAEVLGSIERIPGTDWILVAKTDMSEADAPVRSAAYVSITVAVLLGLALLGGVGVAWRTQAASVERDQSQLLAERAMLAEQFAFLSRNANDAVLLCDRDHRIVAANERATDIYGYSHAELVGMTLRDLRDPATTLEGLFEAENVSMGESAVFEMEHLRRDGSRVAVEVSARAIEQDGAWRLVEVVRDITSRKEQEHELEAYRQHLEAMVDSRTEELGAANEELTSVNEELAATNEELAATNEELASVNEELSVTNEDLVAATRAKSVFLANMSHELRTPLNSIIGFTGVMLQGLAGSLTEEQRSQLAMVRRSGDRLLALISDMLDLSRIEAGRLGLKISDVEAGDVVAAAEQTVRQIAGDRGLELIVHEVPASVFLRTDEGKLHQVLVNLLANAVKFTDEGSVMLTVTRPDPDTVQFEVTDTGVGIETADLDAVFDEFVQLPRDGAKPEGTGLGLAISRRLAMLLGGSLTAKSVVGEGSTFILRLPTVLEAPPE
jgi:PAS domain S-box-containing protein